MKSFHSLVIIFLINMNVFCQTADFRLTQKIYHADFNYHFIECIDTCFHWNIDSCDIKKKILSKGFYSIYVFERHLEMFDKLGGKSERIECVFQKVFNDTIVESIYIPLTWREPPISAVILYSNIKFKICKYIEISSLDFHSKLDYGINILPCEGYIIYE